MKTLQIDERKARKLYSNASPEFKAALEDSFGVELFSVDIMYRIHSYEDACMELGIGQMKESEMLQAGFRPDEIARRKLEVITLAFNEGKYVDWDNSGQAKYYPWLKRSSGGFVFNSANWTATSARTGHASRICLKRNPKRSTRGKISPKYSD